MTVDSQKPLVLVIFGITGDLAHRKLLPAVYNLLKNGHLPDKFKVIGITRRDYPIQQLFDEFTQNCPGDIDPEVLDQLQNAFEIKTLDMASSDDFSALRADFEALSEELPGSNRIYYLSIPAQAFVDVVGILGNTGHATKFKSESADPRILVEKPFGYNLQSAKVLIAATEAHYNEDQIYRIDHYLAKETAQNILTFRFNNSLFENIWNSKHIDVIKITAHESIGIEGRAHFYEQTGALRDLIQSHLIQLLALITMEKPRQFDSHFIHKTKLRLLESVDPILVGEVASRTLRGQYNTYRNEVDNPDSFTETFARAILTIDNEKWRDTEFILEAGKALAQKDSRITVHFRDTEGRNSDNTLIFKIQPNEGVAVTLQAKKPGLNNELGQVTMDFNYNDSFVEDSAEAYQRVIIDAIRGDQSLFLSSAEVIASWQIFESVIEVWNKNDDGLTFYDTGSNPQDL